jgi:hypothetical protein
MKKIDELIREIKKVNPKFEIRFKNESKMNKAISKILFFAKDYMTRNTTTLFGKVYFPNKDFFEKDCDRTFRILSHEYVHVYDSKKLPILFELGYLFPQILSLFAFFAFYNLWFLLFLLFLLPIPAPFRTYFEFRGYSMTYMIKALRGNNNVVLKSIDKKFSGPVYYYMWPFSVADDIYLHDRNDYPYRAVKKILEN